MVRKMLPGQDKDNPVTLQNFTIAVPNSDGSTEEKTVKGIQVKGIKYFHQPSLIEQLEFSNSSLVIWQTECKVLGRPIQPLPRYISIAEKLAAGHRAPMTRSQRVDLLPEPDITAILKKWADAKRVRTNFSDDGDWPTNAEACRYYKKWGATKTTLWRLVRSGKNQNSHWLALVPVKKTIKG